MFLISFLTPISPPEQILARLPPGDRPSLQRLRHRLAYATVGEDDAPWLLPAVCRTL